MTTERQPARRSCSPTSCAVRTLLTVSCPATSSGTCPPSRSSRAAIAAAHRRSSAKLSSSLVATTCARSSLSMTRPTGVLRTRRLLFRRLGGERRRAPTRSAREWVAYDGYPSHGSPRTCNGDCPAHIHFSWVSACYGSSALVAPCGWVMAFPAPKWGPPVCPESPASRAWGRGAPPPPPALP